MYISKREKISDFIGKRIIGALETSDLDYDKTIQVISAECFCSTGMAKDILEGFVSLNRIKIIPIYDKGTLELKSKVLTIPDDEITSWLIKRNKEKPLTLNKAEEILKEAKDGDKDNPSG